MRLSVDWSSSVSTSKAPQRRRTPKPGGVSGVLGGRGSVLECGSPVPLSELLRQSAEVEGVSKVKRAYARSGAVEAHSKTGRSCGGAWWTRQRLGVREPCPAFGVAEAGG